MTNPFQKSAVATAAPAAPAPAAAPVFVAPAPAAPAPTPAAPVFVAPAAAAPAPAAATGDPFASPTGVSGERITSFVDKLLLVKPLEYIAKKDTKMGTTDVMRVDLAVLDDAEDPGRVIRNILVFQTALKRETRDLLESRAAPFMLARLRFGKLENGNTLYTFEKATPQESLLASQFLEVVDF